MDRLLRMTLIFAMALGFANIYGCGDGGGGSNGGDTTSSKGKAVIVFSTSLPAGSTEQIGSVQLTFELPAGVTISTDPSGAIPNGANGVLSLSGEASRFAAQTNAVTPTLIGKYTPATVTNKATVNLGIIILPNNSKGMNPGEFATLVCDLAPGVTVNLADFTSTSLLIGNTAGLKLYDNLGGITGPASGSFAVTLHYDSLTGVTGSTSTSVSF